MTITEWIVTWKDSKGMLHTHVEQSSLQAYKTRREALRQGYVAKVKKRTTQYNNPQIKFTNIR